MRRLLSVSGFALACVIGLVLNPLGVSAATSRRAIVTLKTPAGLAVSPTGALYIVDAGRDQILRQLHNGKFRVVAGSGHRGFSGDGHSAVSAQISIAETSGITVARNGTIYFADTGNDRVREILSDGVIETIAGGGTQIPGTTPLLALRAKFDAADQLNGLTIGPGGSLYIAANGVYRLGSGTLHWVVGSDAKRFNKGFKGFGISPVVQKDFDPAYTLAFDVKGDLLVGGGGTWSLYERTNSGAFRFIQEDRAQGGYYAAMATAPGGGVVLAGGAHGLSRFHSSGLITTVVATGLSTLLPSPSHFTVGAGVAVAGNGTIYLDTDANNGFTKVSAIVEVTTAGRAVLV
ncbi:MAG: NHL repeat-containing protein [Acidimicrobiales bacterium]